MLSPVLVQKGVSYESCPRFASHSSQRINEATRGKHETGQLDAICPGAKGNTGRVLDEIKGTGGKVLQTSLSHEDEAKLKAALSAPKQ